MFHYNYIYGSLIVLIVWYYLSFVKFSNDPQNDGFLPLPLQLRRVVGVLGQQSITPTEQLSMQFKGKGSLCVVTTGKVKVKQLVDVANVHFLTISLFLIEILPKIKPTLSTYQMKQLSIQVLLDSLLTKIVHQN